MDVAVTPKRERWKDSGHGQGDEGHACPPGPPGKRGRLSTVSHRRIPCCPTPPARSSGAHASHGLSFVAKGASSRSRRRRGARCWRLARGGAFGVASERPVSTKRSAGVPFPRLKRVFLRRCGKGGENLFRDPADRLLGVFHGERFVSLDVLRFSEKAHRAFEGHSSPRDEGLPFETEISSVALNVFEPVLGGDAETLHG